MKISLVIFAAILCVKAPGLQNAVNDGCNGMSGKKVYIIADDGEYLARCLNCGPAFYPNSAAIHGQAGDEFAMWTLESAGENKCAIKADNGLYAARCLNCWYGEAFENSVFVHAPDSNPAYAQWTMEAHGEYFSFKADNDLFMARCNRCVMRGAKPNFAFVSSKTYDVRGTLWKVQVV